MKPYYQNDAVTIYHGDCREILPTLGTYDLLLTDPPYGMAFQSNSRGIKHKRVANDEEIPLDLIWLALSKVSAAGYVFCRWDNLQQLPKPRSVIAWVKNNWSMGDLAHEHGRQWEACCFYPKSKHQFKSRIPDVINASRTGNNLHPTEKPVALMSRIIGANVAETVLDPFMGSGTTLVAAQLEGRRAVGIELDEKYCEIAAERCRQKVLF